MNGTAIRSIQARQVYTNRGNPGVEAIVTTENGATGRAMCTSGISVRTHEIKFRFDGGTKFGGKGVQCVADRINHEIAPKMIGVDAANQLEADRVMLSLVPNAKAVFGGNATAAVSAAILKAGAASLGIPLYRHVGGASAMYLPVPGVAMVAGDERYGGGITTPGGKPTMSVMAFGFETFSAASYACWEVHTRWAEKMKKKFGGLPNIRDFISIPAGIYHSDREIWADMFKQYINGKTVEGKGKISLVYDPSNGEVIDTVSCADAAQTQEALLSAAAAFRTWSKTSVNERYQWLMKLRAACMEARDTLVDLVSFESGRPYPAACGDVDWLLTSLLYYAEEAKRINGAVLPTQYVGNTENYHIVTRTPIGVTVGHIAWNYPLGNASIKLAPAVASGCTCIIKPSSETPLATLYLGVIAEKIGFPAGVINIVSGPADEVAKTLNESDIPRMITLIGSYETGLKLLSQSATSVKKYSLELGRNASVIVMPDADLDETAANIVAKKVGFAGQTCVNYNRIYVHADVYDALCDKVATALSKVKLGRYKNEGYIMGPVINKKARDRMLDLIADAVQHGAKLVMGGEIPTEFIEGCKKLDPYSEPLDRYLMHPTEDVKKFAVDRIKVLGADRYGK